MENSRDDHPIIARNVWKIFGERAQEAHAAILSDNLSKAEVLEQFGCVIGVADASFSIEEGEIFCIMGLSGSGKSTLVRHVNRLLEPTAGEILIEGSDVTKLNESQLRDLRNQKVAMVFQNFGLMPHRTVRDNVAMPLEIRGASKRQRWSEADRVLDMVNLTGWEDKYAHELSGGMQQRVGLARALACNPGILLMDEPFSALDPLIRRQLQDQFMDLSATLKKTTIFITHDLDEAIRIGNRIAIMKDGRIVQTGTPEDIVMNPADDYVADFVAGISKLDLVYAHSIMVPMQGYESEHGPVPGDASRTSHNSDLNELINVAVETEGPIVIEGDDGAAIGIVDRTRLMRAIQGNRKQEAAANEPA
ncbi:quaternary amine ABC transporter ATP-binding protein [Hoeflea prorocentri]|uniref:Quaternary amine transport ATP-binding protein n=1 Tax=Hoeflea prorocentri TaxID=1922333 RepID=A0A9X3ZIP7_9HYPH|nr:glycine betaine/L-proline ABC transporter ATP-binding protein [Hoeflea prorocentri]MCY6382066.1 glycine betaine/L-proline ABC transporter ATP-binding protein [Hoeflea prorocentri]MDA5399866.1 glycine betaine/L-proline ABC transporter ATP-binding protein [Hoeflea prorocentri]